MSASHPAGKGEDANPRKDLWPPPEGTEETNPLGKLLMDTSSSQDSLLEDYLLTNRINIHRLLFTSTRVQKRKDMQNGVLGHYHHPARN